MLFTSSQGINLVQADARVTGRKTQNKQDEQAYDPTRGVVQKTVT
jgi:hypothetical protein